MVAPNTPADLSMADPGQQLTAVMSGDRDLLARFEALSNMFKSEVEGLFGREQETAREDLLRLRDRERELREDQSKERAEVAAMLSELRDFMRERYEEKLPQVFDAELLDEGSEPAPASGAAQLHEVLTHFLQVCSSEAQPKLDEAQSRIRELEREAEVRSEEMASLREQLAEAQQLKSEEERALLEFKALREKESEFQTMKIEVQDLQCQVKDLEAQNRLLDARSLQQQAVLKEKAEKIVDLVRQLEQQGEQVRLLSDENNTLRLELGRDEDYLKALPSTCDPLSLGSADELEEDLLREEAQLREELRSLPAKFPGLVASGNCGKWCDLQTEKVASVYKSFLHRLQVYRKEFPATMQVELVFRSKEAERERAHQEDQLREATADFQDKEQLHTQRWDQVRQGLMAERDGKVKQLLEQADRSKSKAEQQLLVHQAKLFGQRLDAKIEKAWEEQRKERDERWAEHQQMKLDSRQKLKEDLLQVQQQAEEKASSTERFLDLAKARLDEVEDAWVRNAEKTASLSVNALKSGDLSILLKTLSSGDEPRSLPAPGSQQQGLSLILERVEAVLKGRIESRAVLRGELETHSLQQLRSLLEKFTQKEAGLQKRAKLNDDEVLPEFCQAPGILGLLRVRQHRHLGDVLRRQFQDYMLILRLCSTAAVWLLPQRAPENAPEPTVGRRQVAARDLPPLRAELAQALGLSQEPEHHPADEDQMLNDQDVEENFLYNALCQQLLAGVLSLLNRLQKEELLGLKRAYVGEQRRVLEQLCQLEGDFVTKVVQQDLREFELQASIRLVAETERSFCEQRKFLAEQVAKDVASQVVKYQRMLVEEELALVRERSKWLSDRLVVLQSRTPQGPAEKVLAHRLRQELRACDLKGAQHEKDLAGQGQPSRPPSSRGLHRPPSASRQRPQASSALPPRMPVDTPRTHSKEAPAGYQSPPSSPLLSARAEGAPKRVAALTLPTWQPQAPHGVTCASPEFGNRPEQPLYEWPFEGARVMEKAISSPPMSPGTSFSARSLSAPGASRLKPLDCLKGKYQDLQATTLLIDGPSGPAILEAGYSGSVPKVARNRSVPPFLPPVQTPR